MIGLVLSMVNNAFGMYRLVFIRLTRGLSPWLLVLSC